ncbi:MAG: hypothetical protein KA369_14005 [Spirochaetes bacterium]|nr:hypothetical protein [Spirochaetota bacterium]
MKKICALSLAVMMLFGIACKKDEKKLDPATQIVLFVVAMAPPCSATGAMYHELTLDYITTGYTPIQMGQYFGQQTKALVPDFERIFDWYIYTASIIVPYTTMITRALEIKKQIRAEYQQEMEGLASVCTGTEDKALDGKLSPNELYLLQVLPDAWVSASCSSVAVFGSSASPTNKTIIGRNLEWFGGFPNNYLSKLQAVVTIKNTVASSRKDVCLIGYLGFIGCITGFNDQGLFGAIQVSNGDPDVYNATGKGSYNMNLRDVLETQNSVANAGNYLTTSDPYEYAAGHLLVFADPTEAQVFEYEPDTPRRGMRAYNSTRKGNAGWVTQNNTIGAVNSFVLEGFYDNHSGNNVSRWNSMRDQLQLKLDDGGSATVDEIKQVITYYQGTSPGAVEGDLYREHIQQTIIYQPAAGQKNVEVHFHPLCVASPGYPSTAEGFFTPIVAAF